MESQNILGVVEVLKINECNEFYIPFKRTLAEFNANPQILASGLKETLDTISTRVDPGI